MPGRVKPYTDETTPAFGACQDQMEGWSWDAMMNWGTLGMCQHLFFRSHLHTVKRHNTGLAGKVVMPILVLGCIGK